MGTAGNRSGFKAFSFNTTLRNPRRNLDFLAVVNDGFDGKLFDYETKNKFYYELLRKGIYRPLNSTQAIMNKYETGADLTPEEIELLVNNNIQATGNAGRVMTQLRGLKDLGFLKITRVGQDSILKITDLGYELLELNNLSDVYTKIMIGLHAYNPGRKKLLNKARPFLNTIFVISELNKYQISIGEKPSGINRHEFGFYVLTMKDCDYKKISREIIAYRKINRFSMNKKMLENYVESLNILPSSFDTYIKDYPDDVFRKFELTNLLVKNRFGYLNFNTYEMEKINQILNMYDKYEWKKFSSVDEYNNYLFNIKLPWSDEDKLRKILIEKSKVLSIETSENLSIESQIQQLDKEYYSDIFERVIKKYSNDVILEEIEFIKNGSNQSKIKKLVNVNDPIKLEWLIAALLAKSYENAKVKPNMILDTHGYPISYAPGNKADIEIVSSDSYGTVEVTLIRNRNQQLNSETTSVARHLLQKKNESLFSFAFLIAPFIHIDTIRYFKFETAQNNIPLIPVSIDKFTKVVKQFKEYENFLNNVADLGFNLSKLNTEEFSKLIN